MTETRAAYNVILQPGRELDALVARVILRDEYDEWAMLLDYSTDPTAAMDAWTWLEENHPWKAGILCLFRGATGQCVVGLMIGVEIVKHIANSDTYPHSIALAVVEAGKVLGVIDIDIKP